MFNICRENILLKKWLHHFFEVIFPFDAMRFCLMLMLVPGMQVRKFVYCCYQEGVRVQVVINGNTVPLTGMRGPVVAKFSVAVS